MKLARISALCLAAALTACGGGGSEAPQQQPESVPAAPEPAPAASVPAGPPPETGPRGDLPAPLVGVVLPYPVAVFGDSMARDLGAALQSVLAVDVMSGGVGSSVSWQARAALDAYPDKGRIVIIWTGHNNFSDPQRVLDDVAAMVASLGHRRYLVLGLAYEDLPAERIGGAGRAVKLQINAALAEAYPGRLVDPNPMLRAWSNPRNPLDVAADLAGVTPSSLRDGGLHLTPYGAKLVASEIAAKIEAAAW